MSERTPEALRVEIASEREGLAGDLDVLRGQARSLVPFVVAAVVVLVLLLLRKRLVFGVRLLWRLR